MTIDPWKGMSEAEKTKELLEAGVNPEMIKNKEKVERLKRKSKLFTFLLIFFVSISLIAVIGILAIKEDTKLLKINELKIIAGVAILGIILLYLPEKKKSTKPLVGRLGKT